MNHQTILDSLTLFPMDPRICKLLMTTDFRRILIVWLIPMFVAPSTDQRHLQPLLHPTHQQPWG